MSLTRRASLFLVLPALCAWCAASLAAPAGPAQPASSTSPAPGSPPAPAALPSTGKAAPGFVLTGADGKKHALSDYRGRPVVLYFFCGCQWCQQVAQAWGQIQRGGALIPEPGASNTAPAAKQPLPITLVVYAGDAGAARDFANQEGMDLTQTVLLPDTEMQVTDSTYHAEPCPRVLVIDPKGIVRYVNDHKDDTPRVAPALAIVSRTIDAVRSCEAQGGKKP